MTFTKINVHSDGNHEFDVIPRTGIDHAIMHLEASNDPKAIPLIVMLRKIQSGLYDDKIEGDTAELHWLADQKAYGVQLSVRKAGT